LTERTLVASLPMYDWPEVRWAHDALWSAVATRLETAGIPAPKALDRARPSDEVWRDPGLVLSQTCGYPYATRLSGHLRIVATPIYDVEGCDGPLYSSAIIVRKGEGGRTLADFAGRRFAYNSDDSLSGYVAPRAEMRCARLDADAFTWVEVGSHRESVRAVANGNADIASIDAVCWALAQEYEAESVAKLQVLAWTPKRPSLPFVSARAADAVRLEKLRAALAEAIAASETAPAWQALRLSGVAVISESDYMPIAALG
jgi:ABC-type phosphate/phosphonate transport system substrate-binding protein